MDHWLVSLGFLLIPHLETGSWTRNQLHFWLCGRFDFNVQPRLEWIGTRDSVESWVFDSGWSNESGATMGKPHATSTVNLSSGTSRQSSRYKLDSAGGPPSYLCWSTSHSTGLCTVATLVTSQWIATLRGPTLEPLCLDTRVDHRRSQGECRCDPDFWTWWSGAPREFNH